MGDLIDRDALIRDLSYAAPELFFDKDYLAHKIAMQPAVDAVPVIYSEWSWADGGKCKNCGFHNSDFDYNYCPMCGAKIRR